uniref:MADF domain-containing protein n=1 Tax=Parascaris univalens TaxID=6257 RepID=A0A914ZI50_PARUN
MESTKGGPDSSFNDSLIREVRRNPIVFDTSHPLYGNALKKQEAWNEIATKLGEKVEAIKTRWRTLRDRYTKERRRISINGGGSSFSYYADLSFLDLFMNEGRRQMVTSASSGIKQETFEQASDAGDDFDSRNGDNARTDAEELTHVDDTEASVSGSERVSPQQRPSTAAGSLCEQIANDEAPPQRKRLRTIGTAETPTSSVDTLADALVRSADALQRIAERRSSSLHRSADTPRDADECFADFVCMSLKAIDNESRVHARIAILHALAQFQT